MPEDTRNLTLKELSELLKVTQKAAKDLAKRVALPEKEMQRNRNKVKGYLVSDEKLSEIHAILAQIDQELYQDPDLELGTEEPDSDQKESEEIEISDQAVSSFHHLVTSLRGHIEAQNPESEDSVADTMWAQNVEVARLQAQVSGLECVVKTLKDVISAKDEVITAQKATINALEATVLISERNTQTFQLPEHTERKKGFLVRLTEIFCGDKG